MERMNECLCQKYIQEVMEWYSAVQSRIFHNFLQCEVQLQVALEGVADSMRNVAERISDWQRMNPGLTGVELAEKLLVLEEEVLGGAISHAEKIVKEHKLAEQQKRKEEKAKSKMSRTLSRTDLEKIGSEAEKSRAEKRKRAESNDEDEDEGVESSGESFCPFY